MGHKHSKEEILTGALDVAFEHGLSQLTYGRVGKRLGMGDRTVVYYFPSKEDLVTEVLLAIGLRLQETLAVAFARPAADHVDLLRAAWPVLAEESVDPMFALFFEANGLAAAGRSPYDALVPLLVEGWIDWVSESLSGTPAERRIEAETAIAVIDGLLLLRQLGGAEAADRAAGRLGVISRR